MRVARRALRAVARFWSNLAYLNDRLLAQPGELDGPLRWQRDVRGWRLLGAELPVQRRDRPGPA